jgi:glycosyltransferase involved in cell wall biosynthesis
MSGPAPQPASPCIAADAVTVVIPVYNGAADLAEALQSVLDQTLQPFEILVIDDGSSDNSAALAASFAGVRVVSFPNAGLAESRNRGLRLASTPWVAFLDHDDIWMPSKLEKQMLLLARSPGAGACATYVRRFHQTGSGRVHQPLEDDLNPHPERDLPLRNVFCPSSMIVRRELSLAVGGFDASLRSAEDWDHWLALAHAGCSFVYCPEQLVSYRLHSNNMSNNSMRMFNAEMQLFERRIAPHAHPLWRPFLRRSMKARFLAGVARSDRSQNLPHLRSMFRSIATWPIGYWIRYKQLASMIVQKFQPGPPHGSFV